MTAGGVASTVAGSWVRPRGDVERWMRTAKAGEKLLYAHGPDPARGETFSYVAALYRSGLVELVQPRSADRRGFDFIVQKRRAEAPGAAAGAAEEADPATDRILRALKRAANFGRKCPTDLELARIAGLSTRNQASWRVRELARIGKIKVDTIETGPDARWRTVTIVETMKQTLQAPSLRVLQRSVREVDDCDGREALRGRRD
jgi:hypothetical protein